MRRIKFICHAIRWFDRVNGNTYHSVKVTRCCNGKEIYGEFQYGYDSAYRYTALETMSQANWLPRKYRGHSLDYERENNYPIEWIVSDGLKRECIANGKP